MCARRLWWWETSRCPVSFGKGSVCLATWACVTSTSSRTTCQRYRASLGWEVELLEVKIRSLWQNKVILAGHNMTSTDALTLFSVRKSVGELPTERGDLRKTIVAVSKWPWCHWKLWHVCVSGHCYIIHCPSGDLLPICYGYVHENMQAGLFYPPKGLNSLSK